MPDVVGILESSNTGLSIEYEAVEVDGDLLLFVKRLTKLIAVESFLSLSFPDRLCCESLLEFSDTFGLGSGTIGPSLLLRLNNVSMCKVLLQFDKLDPVDGWILLRGGRSGGGCNVF